MQGSLSQHVPQPLCCWWQCCFRAHTAMPGVFFSDLRKSKKCSASHWECKWWWSFCSTTRDKLETNYAPGDIIRLTSEMTAEAEQEQQSQVTSGKVTLMGVKQQGWVHPSANGQKGIPKRADCCRQWVLFLLRGGNDTWNKDKSIKEQDTRKTKESTRKHHRKKRVT